MAIAVLSKAGPYTDCAECLELQLLKLLLWLWRCRPKRDGADWGKYKGMRLCRKCRALVKTAGFPNAGNKGEGACCGLRAVREL